MMAIYNIVGMQPRTSCYFAKIAQSSDELVVLLELSLNLYIL